MQKRAQKNSAYLSELRIARFRGVTPNTVLVFDPEWNILLGKNGSGKTTLLLLTEAIFSGRFDHFAQEEFSLSFDIMVGDLKVTVTLDNQPEEAPTRAAQVARQRRSEAKPRRPIRFSVSVTGAKTSTPILNLLMDGGSMRIETASGETRTEMVVEYNWLDTVIDAAINLNRDSQGLEAQLGSLFDLRTTFRFDESLGAFERLIRHGYLKVNRWTKQNSTHAFGDLPRDLCRRIEKQLSEKPTKVGKDLVFDSQEVPFLSTFKRLWGGEAARLVLQFDTQEVSNELEEIEYHPFGFRFAQSEERSFAHSGLSYGQKRLLAFLHYAATNRGAVIADELVNGLHYDWIQHCVDEIAGRQKFLTSQNPLLLDHLKFESIEDVRTRFLTCEAHEGTFVWKNLSEEQAIRFFTSYEQGIQYVGEILRTQNLW